MNSIELQKPSGERFVVYDRRPRPTVKNFQVLSGYVDTVDEEQEMLLPTGFRMLANGDIETPQDRQKRKTATPQKSEKIKQVSDDDDDEALYPVGVHPK